MSVNNHKEFYTVTEIAKILGISRTHVLRKIEGGEIVATKVGKSYIIKEKDLPGIYRPLTEREKEDVELSVEKTLNRYEDIIKKLGDA